jgi:hypothetical protein
LLLAHRSSRRAISLTEVLIAMGILTLGLLGVAALFPVGGFYMQRAEIADRGSAIAQSAMNEIVSRGMLNPRSWYVMVPLSSGVAGQRFPSDGRYSPIAPQLKRGTYSRPFALALSEALNQPTAATNSTLISQQFGSAYVIDPMGVAAMAFPNPDQGAQDWNSVSSVFPASAELNFSSFYTSPESQWQAWGPFWPVRRVTFRQSSTGWQLDPTMAEHFARASDDLVFDLPPRDDRPALQNWDRLDVDGDDVPDPLSRQWTGDYSWMVTVVPNTNAARDGMVRNPEGHAYDVSVVVFHKRVLPPPALTATSKSEFRKMMSENERSVKARILSTGPNGGELLLERFPYETTTPFDQLKASQWIMLCGPHPNSNVNRVGGSITGEPRFALNWYQVVSVEGRDRRLNDDGAETPPPGAGEPERRVVTVRGPRWAWGPSTDNNNISNNLCVAICRGAVAVHTKTMRLESPRSSSVAFGEAGNLKTTPPRFGPF